MDTPLWQNSYIIFVVSLVLLLVIFNIFQIGVTYHRDATGKLKKQFSWAYPLAISIVIWAVWHFWLYPSGDGIIKGGNGSIGDLVGLDNGTVNKSGAQKLNLDLMW
jgi:hypothetical protein